MKNLLFFSMSLGILFFCFGCPNPTIAPIKFNLERPFALKLGQTGEAVSVKEFSIKFDKVSADSRCALGLTCVTAGQVDVVLTISIAGETKTVTLPFMQPNGTSNVIDFKGQTVRILGVTPFKVKDKELKPEEYMVTLSVIETPAPAPKAKVGEGFALGVGQSIVLEEDPMFRIRFDKVSGDSRCPEGVKCIWAGRVDAGFTLMQGDSSFRVTIAIGDFSQGGKSEAKFGPYSLKIKAIAPPKQQGAPIPQTAYKAMMELSK